MRKSFPLIAALLAVASVLTGVAMLANRAQADSCAQDVSFTLSPYETRSFSACSFNNPYVVARSDDGSDIDAALIDSDGDAIAIDTQDDGEPVLRATAHGYNEYTVLVSNATGDYVHVTMNIR